MEDYIKLFIKFDISIFFITFVGRSERRLRIIKNYGD